MEQLQSIFSQFRQLVSMFSSQRGIINASSILELVTRNRCIFAQFLLLIIFTHYLGFLARTKAVNE